MLYFSKFKIIVIYIIIFFLTSFSLLNFFNSKDNFLLSKNINLGLDLQGGSYLLLEVDTKPVIKQYLQNKLLSLRKVLKKKKIKYENLKISDNTIKFIIKNDEDLKNFESFFKNKKNLINPYYEQYKSFELDYSISNNLFKINFSKYLQLLRQKRHDFEWSKKNLWGLIRNSFGQKYLNKPRKDHLRVHV